MSDLVERLRAVDHMSVEDCFLQSPLFAYAADEIERLRARVAKLEEALIAENDLITDCQTVLTRYLEGLPRGITKDAAVSALLGLLDGPQQREAQSRAREALESKP